MQFVQNYLDLVRRSSSLVAVHFADKCFAHVAHTLADFLAVVGIRLVDDLLLAVFHDDTLEAQHSVHSLAVRMEASWVDSCLADTLDLNYLTERI